MNLCNRTNLSTWENIAKQVPSIKVENGMYISKDNVLIGYEGKSEKLVVPEGITTIANNVIKGEGYNPDSKIAKEIVIPDTVKVIEDRAFFSRYNLEKVTLPKNLTEIGDYAFFECNIKEIEIPNTITKWGKNVFSSCALEKVTIPTNIKEIPEGMFDACYKLKNIVIPDNIEKINEGAFWDCRNLESVTIGKNVKSIGKYAFQNTKLTTITIPSNVQKIDFNAFCGCDSLEKFVIEGKTDIANGVFDNTSNVVLDYRLGAQYNKTSVQINNFKRDKKNYLKVKASWAKVKGISGYEVKVATDKKFKKNVKNVKVNETKTTVTVKQKVKNVYNIKRVYVKVTPYTYVNGKKVYGKSQTDLMK